MAPVAVPTGTLPGNREGSTVDDAARDLTTADVIERAGCTYRQLDYWCRTFGLCGSDRMRGRDQGSGHPRYFTRTEARAARTLRHIGDVGVNVGLYARAVLEALLALPHAEYIGLSFGTVTAYADGYEMLAGATATDPALVIVKTFYAADIPPQEIP